MLPFLLAVAIGSWNGVTGLHADGAEKASFVCGLTIALAVAAGGFLVVSVRSRAGEGAPFGVLVVAGTYAADLAGGRGGPVSAGLVGLAVLGLAFSVQYDSRVFRRLPVQTMTWTWRTTLWVAAASVLLDAVVAVVSGAGTPRPGSLSPLAVLAGCAAVTAFAGLVLALAEGVSLPALGRRPADLQDAPETAEPGAGAGSL